MLDWLDTNRNWRFVNQEMEMGVENALDETRRVGRDIKRRETGMGTRGWEVCV